MKTLDVFKITEEVKERHRGQVDKAGEPYIHHCFRVALSAYEKGTTEKDKQRLVLIGLLHDILEDTDLTYEELQDLCPDEKILDAVLLLTRLDKQSYFEYIDLISFNRLATLVKLSDIEDHLRVASDYILPESLKMRYQKAQKQLLESPVL